MSTQIDFAYTQWGTNSLLVIAILVVASLLSRWMVQHRAPSAPIDTKAPDLSLRQHDDYVSLMKENNKEWLFLYASQTGTARNFALHLAKEAKSRLGITGLLVNMAQVDLALLDQLPGSCITVFVIATYGEGEPPDDARNAFDFLDDGALTFSGGGSSLIGFRYAIFGCGNSSYEHFNQQARFYDSKLQSLSGVRVGELGLGDENGTVEEDFFAWKESLFNSFPPRGPADGKNRDDFRITIRSSQEQTLGMGQVYHGELAVQAGHYCPIAVPVTRTLELFQAGAQRSCIHTELDISASGLRYQAGDHIGIWPCNPDSEVDRMFAILGHSVDRHTIVEIEANDPLLCPVPFPSPVTLQAIFRHYLDLCFAPSRNLLGMLAEFAPTQQACQRLQRICADKDEFRNQVTEPHLRLCDVLLAAAGDEVQAGHLITPWPKLPLAALFGALPRLQPRYYSISSSPLLHPNRVHITSVVLQAPASVSRFCPGRRVVYGVGTGYLSYLKRMSSPATTDECGNWQDIQTSPTYALEGPCSAYRMGDRFCLPVHIRSSSFKLPRSPHIPIIMIGPGTGVAPFRAFVQERVALARKALELDAWGPMHLFYGCRKRDEDFLYRQEWDEYARSLQGHLQMHCAFSREEPLRPDGTRTYVQDLLWESRVEISRLIKHHNAYVYICGDAKGMCRAVEAVLARILNEGGQSEYGLDSLRKRRRLLLDVWG